MNNKLTIEELNYVQSEVKQKGKSLSISYLLLLTFGLVGIHLGYLERTKTAIFRAILTISTAGLLYPITKILLEFNSIGVTTQLQQYSATFLVIALLMIGVNVIWTMYDLVSLPSMVKETNGKIEEKFTLKAIEARYVKEKLIKEEVSQYLVEQTSNAISEEIKIYIEKEKANIGKELIEIEKELMVKREEILDLVEHVSSNLEELKKSYENFDSMSKELKESQNEKLNSIKAELNEEIDNFIKESKELIEEKFADNVIINSRKSEIKPVEELRKELVSLSQDEPKLKSDDYLTVEKAIEKGSGRHLVKGFIVGNMSPNRQRVFFDYFDNEMNIAIADSPNETDRNKMIIVQLTWESGLRNNVGLITNKNNLKRPVMVNGDLEYYFKGTGMKQIISVEMIDTKDKFISNDI